MNISCYNSIPTNIIGYWLSQKTIKNFGCPSLGDAFITREGMATADNDRFLRFWYEVDFNNVCYDATDYINAIYTGKKWFPYNKGGDFRRWYGNNEYLVNWYLDGKEIKNNIDPKTKRIRSHNYNGEFAFREGLTWSSLSSKEFSLRYSPKGYLFDSKGAKGFPIREDEKFYIAGLLNSKISKHYLSFIAPTIDFKVGDIIQIPYIKTEERSISCIVENNIKLSENDWDAFETSCDFKKHPLM